MGIIKRALASADLEIQAMTIEKGGLIGVVWDDKVGERKEN